MDLRRCRRTDLHLELERDTRRRHTWRVDDAHWRSRATAALDVEALRQVGDVNKLELETVEAARLQGSELGGSGQQFKGGVEGWHVVEEPLVDGDVSYAALVRHLEKKVAHVRIGGGGRLGDNRHGDLLVALPAVYVGGDDPRQALRRWR